MRPRKRRSSEKEPTGSACHNVEPAPGGALSWDGVTNPYLVGNFAPVAEELTVEVPLPVEGAIPPALEGMLVRNGPNPAVRPRPRHLPLVQRRRHGARRRALGGAGPPPTATGGCSTRKLSAEVGTPYPFGPAEAIDGPANTHVLWHGGRLLALCESGLPHRLDTAMATIEIEDFDGALTSPMTAHPHADPATGGLAFFGYDVFGPPYLRYHELDAAGELVHSTDVEIPEATMQHDFGVTASRVAFLDLPVVFDRALALAGVTIPFRWDPEAGARVGVLGRGEKGTETVWCGLDPCYAFHVVNAFDDGPAVVLDVCRYATMFDTAPGGLLSTTLPCLERWRVDPAARSVTTTALDDRHVEFPRIDDTLAGRPYRYAYCSELSRQGGQDSFDALVRYDLARDEAVRWDPGPGRFTGRAGLRARPRRAGRRRGVGARASSTTPPRDASDVVVLDASRFGGAPEAVVHLPARVPFGFHGSWVPAPLYR